MRHGASLPLAAGYLKWSLAGVAGPVGGISESYGDFVQAQFNGDVQPVMPLKQLVVTKFHSIEQDNNGVPRVKAQ